MIPSCVCLHTWQVKVHMSVRLQEGLPSSLPFLQIRCPVPLWPGALWLHFRTGRWHRQLVGVCLARGTWVTWVCSWIIIMCFAMCIVLEDTGWKSTTETPDRQMMSPRTCSGLMEWHACKYAVYVVLYGRRVLVSLLDVCDSCYSFKVEIPLMTWVYPVLGMMEDVPSATKDAQAWPEALRLYMFASCCLHIIYKNNLFTCLYKLLINREVGRPHPG